MTSTRNELAAETMSGVCNGRKSRLHGKMISQKCQTSTALSSLPLAALLALGFGGLSHAQDWTGADLIFGSNWSGVGSWTGAGVPGSGETANVSSGPIYQPIVFYTATVGTLNVTGGSVSVSDGQKLDIENDLNLSGEEAFLDGPGFFDVHGQVYISGGLVNAKIIAPAINLTNTGHVNIWQVLQADIVQSGTGETEIAGSDRIIDLEVSLTEIYRTSLKVTNGTVKIYDTQTFTGGTTLEGGILEIRSINPLGSGQVNLNGGTLRATEDLTLENVINISTNGSNGIIDTGAKSVTLSGTLDGAGSFTKQGTGTLIFDSTLITGDYRGGMTLGNGALSLRASLLSDFGTITTTGSTIDYANSVDNAAAIDINSSDTKLQVSTGSTATQSGVISETGVRPVEKIGAGTLVLTATNTYSGVTTITAGTLEIGGTVGQLGTGNVINNSVLRFNRTTDMTVANVISGTGQVVKWDPDAKTILTGANTYSGATSIDDGILNIQNATALGTTASGTVVSGTAALEIQGGITVGAEALELNGTGVSNGGAFRNISGANTYGGEIKLGSASRINSDAGTLTLTGGIVGQSRNLTIGGAAITTISTADVDDIRVFDHEDGTLNISSSVTVSTDVFQNFAGTINNAGILQSAAPPFTYAIVNHIGATFNNLAGGTLRGSVGNLGILNSNTATSLVDGDLWNFGTANLLGTVNGPVINGVFDVGFPFDVYTGVISLQDGAINTLTINGNLQSDAGAILKFDTKLDNPAGQADLITVNGDFTGSFNAEFSNIGVGTLDTPGTTTFITVTGSSDATLGTTTGLLQTSVMENQVVKSGKNWVIQTTIKLNPINKLVGSVVTAQNLVPTSIPDLPLQNSNLKEGCLVTGTGSPFAGRATGASTTTGGNSPNASSSVDVSYGGLQFNIDYGCFDIDGKGSSIRVGALAGFSFGNTGQNDTTQNVMTNSDFETRFGGVYTKFDAANGFFASLSGIHSETSFDLASTISGIDFVHARDFKTSRNAINGEIGMAFKPTADISITPVMGINYSVSELSDMKITGPGGGTLVFDDIVGIVGYTGVTFSKAYSLGDGKSAFSPFVGIKIYNDFGDSVVVTYVSPSGKKTPTYTDKAGTYGELTAGLNYSSFNPGWAGVNQLDASIRADVSFGQQFTSGRVTANLQIKF